MHTSISVHAGRWLMSEIVAPSSRSITDIAADMGVSRQALSTVLNGHASLSADMALRFERQFKISADTLMRMQISYDLAQARLELAG
jgi:antitoxin HigA-1